MSKHLIKIESTPHGVLGVRHAGPDQQYCEAGEIVILKWQPDAKWGLQEAHYTDGDGNVTAIDLTRVKVDGLNVVAFVMPNKDITVGGTFKRFSADDWEGYEAPPTYEGSNGNVMQSDGEGGIVANTKVNVNAGGDVTADGNVKAVKNVNAGGDVTADGNVNAGGDVTAVKNVNAGGDVIVGGSVNVEGYLKLKDTVSGDYYKVEVTNGELVVTAL